MEEKILEATGEFNKIVQFVTEQTGELELHEVEEGIFRRLLRLGFLLLELFVCSLGNGKESRKVLTEQGDVLEYVKQDPRRYLSIFGRLTIRRAYYFREGKRGCYPLDLRLNLPERNYSYLLQKWMTATGAKQTYESAGKWLEEMLGLKIPHRGVQRVTRDLADNVDSFNRNLGIPSPEEEGPILVHAVDCKGIPMCTKDRNPDAVKTPEKPGKKKMACVSALYSLYPFHRTAEQIIASLFRSKRTGPRHKRPERCRPINRRIVASVKKGKAEVFQKAEAGAKARVTDSTGEKIILIDGEISLWRLAEVHFPGWTQIIDFMHVIEKLWIAAHQHYKTGSDDAKDYVKERALLLLEGHAHWVIEDLEIALEDGSLSAGKAHTIKTKVLGYLRKNRHRMKYDEYLVRGLPITTAIIESGCKNLINDRMERSGMIWSIDGAESMLKTRSMILQDTWDEVWGYTIQEEKERRYQTISYLPDPHPCRGAEQKAA